MQKKTILNNDWLNIYNVLLLAILVLSIILQSYKLNWGIPKDSMGMNELSAFHIAEATLVNIPYTMVQTGDLNPHHFIEPSFFYNAMFAAFTALSKITDVHTFTEYVLIARIMAILFTTGVVLLVYLIGKEAENVTLGLYAALLMAINPYYLWFSSIAKEDPMMVFMVMLAMYMFARFVTTGKTQYFLLTMAAAGFAASTKYPAGMLLPFFLVLYFMYNGSVPILDRLRTMTLSLIAYILAFIAGTPYSILAINEFLNGAVSELTHYTTSHPGFIHFTWFVHIQTITGLWDATNIWGKNGYGLTLLLLLVGIIMAISRAKHTDKGYIWYMLIGWIALTSLTFGFLIKIKMGNQLMIMTPAAMIIAGFGFKEILAKLPSKPLKIAAGTIVILLILTYAASGIISSQNDNRYYAAQWLIENVPPDSKIAMTLFAYVPNYFVNKTILPVDMQYLNNSNYDYIVLSSWEYERYLDSKETYPQEYNFYSQLLGGNTRYRQAAVFKRTETARERTLNFGLRALAERAIYRGEVDIIIFERAYE